MVVAGAAVDDGRGGGGPRNKNNTILIGDFFSFASSLVRKLRRPSWT